jgi:hypothetical protein
MYKVITHRWSLTLAAVALSSLATAVAPVADIAGSAEAATKRAARHAEPPGFGGAVFGTVTPEALPVVVQVSRDGREVAQMATTIPVRCEPSEVTVLVPAAYRSVPISASGAFHDSLEGSDSEGSAKGTVTGRFTQSKTAVRSTWTETVVVSGADGSDSCSSGRVSVTATR